MPEIRRLDPADAAIFHALRLEAFEREPATFGTALEEQRERSLDQVAKTLAETTVFGGFVAGELVAMAGFSRMKPLRERHKGTVWSMYVRASARGLGLGGRLLEAVIAHARTEVEILNLVVVSTNQAAVALYERYGFQRWGLEPFALKVGDGAYTTDGYYWLPLTRVAP